VQNKKHQSTCAAWQKKTHATLHMQQKKEQKNLNMLTWIWKGRVQAPKNNKNKQLCQQQKHNNDEPCIGQPRKRTARETDSQGKGQPEKIQRSNIHASLQMTKTQKSTVVSGGRTMINNHWPKGDDGKNTCGSWLGRNGCKQQKTTINLALVGRKEK